MAIDRLRSFFDLHSEIPYYTPSSEGYSKLRETYIAGSPAVPAGIARPQNAEDVAQIVSFAVSEDIPFTVRSGGHDLYGRSFAQDALAIDMRDIKHITVNRERLRASIGGGTLSGSLAERLAADGLATAFGSVPSVGYVGWATHGGYGLLVGKYGMGVDQIVGATLVNSRGQIVEADEEDLEAIRGGGGTVGVIVELTIKVYPLAKVFAGVIFYESSDIVSTIRNYLAGYRGLVADRLPPALGLQPSALNTPMGKVFCVVFLWASDDMLTGENLLARVQSFGQSIMCTVQETTIPKWLEGNAQMIQKTVYGTSTSISVREFTGEVADVFAAGVESMPDDPGTLASVHSLRYAAENVVEGRSVFAAATPHFCIEIVGTSSDRTQAKTAWEWARQFKSELQKTNVDNIEPATYISMTPPDDASYPTLYGMHWKRLVNIKQRKDPNNVFKHAAPQFIATAVRNGVASG